MKPKEYLKQLRNNLSKPPKELLFTYIPTGIGLAIVLFSTLVVILLLYLLPFAKDTFFGRRYEKPPAKAASTVKKVAVLLANYPTGIKAPYTIDYARGKVFTNTRSVRSYYLDSSYGQFALEGKLNGAMGDVFGSFTIPDSTSCSSSAIISAINSAAQVANVDLSGYDYKFYYAIPKDYNCTIAGYSGTNFYDFGGSISVGFTSHEFGHIISLHHSSAWRCKDVNGNVVSISSNCSVIEYPGQGDPDVEGGTNDENLIKQFQAFHRLSKGWMGGSNLLTVTSSGTYSIAPIEQQTTAVQALRIPRTTSDYYYVDFRQPGGIFDNYASSDPYVNGVAIRVAASRPYLIDTTPETSAFTDAPLTAGKSFTDSDKGITIKTLNVGPSGATVEVILSASSPSSSPSPTPTPTPSPAPSDTSPPVVSITNPATGAVVQRNSNISIAASASDNVGVTKVEFLANGSLICTDLDSPYSCSWKIPGKPNTNYNITAKAYDAAGNTASSIVTVTAK